jgi:hypothetical protein
MACAAHTGCTDRENPLGIVGCHPLELPLIALDSSGPSVQAPGATSMQAPGATSVEAQLLF